MPIIKPKKDHQRFSDDMIALAKSKYSHLPTHELLALIAYLCGQVMAMLDQRKYTVNMARELISENIVLGNKAMVDQIKDEKGGRA